MLETSDHSRPCTKWMLPCIYQKNKLAAHDCRCRVEVSEMLSHVSFEMFLFRRKLFMLKSFNSSTAWDLWDIMSGLIKPQRDLSHYEKSGLLAGLLHSIGPNFPTQRFGNISRGIPLWCVPYEMRRCTNLVKMVWIQDPRFIKFRNKLNAQHLKLNSIWYSLIDKKWFNDVLCSDFSPYQNARNVLCCLFSIIWILSTSKKLN